MNLFSNQPLQVPPFGMQLRPYQDAALSALFGWFDNHTGNPLVVVPTGGGKSVILAAFVHAVLEAFPGERILILTHVKELIEQNHATMLRCWPGAPAGIYSAGIGRREHDAPILFGGIQSVYRRAAEIAWADLILVDEAHLIPRSGMGMYRTFLHAMMSANPKVKVIGLTATPYRTDSGLLTDPGDDRIFHGVAYDCDLVQLITDGYLSPVVSRGSKATIDTTAVHTRGGEFIPGELEQAALAGDLVQRAVTELVQRGEDRKAWLVFCCGVDHARTVAAALEERGVHVATVFGETPKDERDTIVRAYKACELRAIVNVNVLTTGFDAPHVDLIALLRPTKSPGLYVQMVGRGLRLAPGKTDCLVLDFGGNVMRHGPLDQVKPRRSGLGEGQPPVKECPECQMFVPIAVRVCECGYKWPVQQQQQHDARPDDQSTLLMGRHPTGGIEKWAVQAFYYTKHTKVGKPPSMRVTYECGFNRRVSEWVCFEHGGYTSMKAHQWWLRHGGHAPVPETTDLALVRAELDELLPPVEITVDVRGEYPKILSVRLGDVEAGVHEFSGVDPPRPPGGPDEDPIPF